MTAATPLHLILTALGAIYILFLPGLALSYAFFRRRTIDLIERAALSFALSIATVPLVAFYLNLLGLKLTRINLLLEVAALTATAATLAWLRHHKPSKAQPPEHKPSEAQSPENHKPSEAQARRHGVGVADESTIGSEPTYNAGVGTKPPKGAKVQFGSSATPTPRRQPRSLDPIARRPKR